MESELEHGHLQIIEAALQVRLRSAGNPSCLIEDNIGPLGELGTPLEVSHDHLLVTPPSHFNPEGKRLCCSVNWQQ